MKIVIAQCPGCPGDAITTPPMGIGYLKSFLESKGYEVAPFDFNIELYHSVSCRYKKLWGTYNMFWQREFSKHIRMFGKYCEEWAKRILNSDTFLIGFSVFNANKMLTLETARRIKEEDKNRLIIFGGPECNIYTIKEFFHKFNFINAFVIGEGEKTLLELVEEYERNRKLKPVPGSVIRKGEELIRGGERKPIEDLDSLPYPNFSGLPIKKYIDNKTIHIQMSRGCYQRCVFCIEHVIWKKYRCRSARNVFNEMRFRFENGYRAFKFCDSTLNGNVKELEHLCELLVKEGLNREIGWLGSFRCRKEMTLSLTKKMKKAGCDYAIIGVESGSQKILNLMRKGYTINIVERCLKNFHNAGIMTHVNLIVGFPGENEKTIKETLDFIKRNRRYINQIEINRLNVLPLSPLFENYASFGIESLHDPQHGNDWVSGKNTIAWRWKMYFKVKEFVENLGIETITWD
jgi:radical SAM superfamily enzyme YgiQ (UPF0313 family)